MALNDEGGMEPQSMLVSQEIYKAARNDKNGQKYANVAIAHWQEGRLHKAAEVLRRHTRGSALHPRREAQARRRRGVALTSQQQPKQRAPVVYHTHTHYRL